MSTKIKTSSGHTLGTLIHPYNYINVGTKVKTSTIERLKDCVIIKVYEKIL